MRLVTSRILGRGRNRQAPLEYSEVQREPDSEPENSDVDGSDANVSYDDELDNERTAEAGPASPAPSLTTDEVWRLLQDSDDEYYFEEKLIFDDDGGRQIGEGDGGLPFLEVNDPGSEGPRVKVDDNPNLDGSHVEHNQSDMMVDKKDKKKKKNKKDKKAGKDKKKSISKDKISFENPAAPSHNPLVASRDDHDEDDDLPLTVMAAKRRRTSPWTLRRERAGARP